MNQPDAFRQNMDRLGVSLEARLLVAVSGGLDSVCLLHLLKNAGYNIAAAHANFKLRGEASELDQALVKDICEKNQIPFFTKVLKIDKKKENVQLKARELRYEWFSELMDSEEFDYLVTAHHLNDRIETFFINLLRGSGIKGLKSIPQKTDRILRPLLLIEKSDLKDFASANKWEWREDASNATDDYLRNTIRHGIAETFSKLSPSANENFGKSIEFLSEADAYFEKEAKEFLENLPRKGDTISIEESVWNKLFNSKPLHKYVLENLGFAPHQFDQLENFAESQSGRFIEGEKYRMYRDRKSFLAEPINETEFLKVEIPSEPGRIDNPISLEWEKLTEISGLQKNNNLAYLDFSKLGFPLILRKWKPGDRFQPLGMKGQKKISDFLTDLKLSVPQKNNTYVVETNGEICWVVGWRIADKFRIREKGQSCFLIKYTEIDKSRDT